MRMVDRDFTEIDLRMMYDRAKNYRRDYVPGGWVVETKHRRQRWEIIVEPDFNEKTGKADGLLESRSQRHGKSPIRT